MALGTTTPLLYHKLSGDSFPHGVDGDFVVETDSGVVFMALGGSWRKVFVLESNMPQSRHIIHTDVLPAALAALADTLP